MADCLSLKYSAYGALTRKLLINKLHGIITSLVQDMFMRNNIFDDLHIGNGDRGTFVFDRSSLKS